MPEALLREILPLQLHDRKRRQIIDAFRQVFVVLLGVIALRFEPFRQRLVINRTEIIVRPVCKVPALGGFCTVFGIGLRRIVAEPEIAAGCLIFKISEMIRDLQHTDIRCRQIGQRILEPCFQLGDKCTVSGIDCLGLIRFDFFVKVDFVKAHAAEHIAQLRKHFAHFHALDAVHDAVHIIRHHAALREHAVKCLHHIHDGRILHCLFHSVLHFGILHHILKLRVLCQLLRVLRIKAEHAHEFAEIHIASLFPRQGLRAEQRAVFAADGICTEGCRQKHRFALGNRHHNAVVIDQRRIALGTEQMRIGKTV